MADILKFMHCGCEYNFCSTKTPPFPEDIFGDGSDGDCHITYNVETAGHVTIPAQEYNFCNLCIDECVTLHFCGNGIPIIKVKENFVNCGTIQLRNPLLCANYEEYIQGLGKVVHNKCNYCYELACAYYNCECFTLACLSSSHAQGGCSVTANCSGNGGYGGGAGEAGGQGGCSGGTGGTSEYANAGGGGGGGRNYAGGSAKGCPALGDGIGGDGGSMNTYSGSSSCYGAGGGGGGGYGYCQGGKGGGSCGTGCSSSDNGGDGGNSYIGKGGDGGFSCTETVRTTGCGGNGGSSYYGDGGKGGCSNRCIPGSGGCSMYGNGGDGGDGVSACFRCCKNHKGGDSLFGIGGCGVTGGNGLDGGGSVSDQSCGSSGIARGGVYGLGLFANNIENNGTIYGRGGDSGYAFRSSCTHKGTDGAEIYIIAGCEYCNAGEISCRAGIGGCYSGGKMPDGEAGFVKFYHM